MQHFTPMQWVLISMANSYGYDKVTYNERLEFIKKAIHDNKLQELWENASEPNMFLASVYAYEDMMAGRPVRTKIGLDATCSGPQILGICTGDESCCKLCNVIDEGKRVDMYSVVYGRMREICPEMPSNIKRDNVKKAIMTFLYGSTERPRKEFGEEYLPVFLRAMKELLPKCVALNEMFVERWDKYASSYSWIMPDNFHVHFDVESMEEVPFIFNGQTMFARYYKKKPSNSGRCLGPNATHSIDSLIAREMVRRCNILPNIKLRIEHVLNTGTGDTTINDLQSVSTLTDLINDYNNTGFFSTRILECINPMTVDMLDSKLINKSKEVLETIESNPYKILCIHDCFFTHPNNIEYLRKSAVNVYAELARSHLMDYILKNIFKEEIFLRRIPDLDKMIMNADYIIC